MSIQHAALAAGGWDALSLVEQMGNVGSEVGRASNAKKRGDEARFEAAYVRALELLDLTISDVRWHSGRRELVRAREVFCDAATGGKEYGSTLESLDAYFLQFALAARAGR